MRIAKRRSAGRFDSSAGQAAALEESRDRRELPARLRAVVASAIDPLEIAASLESHGYTTAVVRSTFGYADVFSFAEHLYKSVGYEPAPATEEHRPRPGSLVDLGRGAVFAAPMLVFAGVSLALRDALSWWAMPLSLLVGFAVSQATGYVSYARLGRAEAPGPPGGWGILFGLAASTVASIVAASLWGGGVTSALFAVGMCSFMTAASWLVVARMERLFALWLLPGVAGSAIFVSGFPFSLPPLGAEAFAGGTVAGTLLTAAWRLPRGWWRVAPVSRREARRAGLYFFHGLASGALIVAFGVLQQGRGDADWTAVATYPLVLSLGAMEWQLRTLHARTHRAMQRHHDLFHFARAARVELARSLCLYMAVFGALAGSVWAIEQLRHVELPTGLWVVGAGLGVTFFLAWAVAGWGRVDLVVASWGGGVLGYGAWEGLSSVTHLARAIGSGSWPLSPQFVFAASAATLCLAVLAVRGAGNPLFHL